MKGHNVIVDVDIVPVGTGSTAIKDYIVEAEKILARYPELKARINPMSTTLEGDIDMILNAVREMHEAPFKYGAKRILTSVRIDDRRDGSYESMQKRVDVVKEKLAV